MKTNNNNNFVKELFSMKRNLTISHASLLFGCCGRWKRKQTHTRCSQRKIENEKIARIQSEIMDERIYLREIFQFQLVCVDGVTTFCVRSPVRLVFTFTTSKHNFSINSMPRADVVLRNISMLSDTFRCIYLGWNALSTRQPSNKAPV